MQNLQWTRPITSHAYSIVSFVVVRSVYMKVTPAGTFPYVDVRNAVSGAPYIGVEVMGVTPRVGQRGVLFHLEGDANTLLFQAVDAPTTEHYIPLLSWYTTVTTSGVPAGVVGYLFPGDYSVHWAWEVVGAGEGSVTLNGDTIPLSSSWNRIRHVLPPTASNTILIPSVTVMGTNTSVSLSLIALVSQSFHTGLTLAGGDH